MSVELIRWTASIAGIFAAIMVAANIRPIVTGLGFVVFTLSSVCWIVAGYTEDLPSLILQNVVLTVINVIGIWRWLVPLLKRH
jgi:hypothetical protein